MVNDHALRITLSRQSLDNLRLKQNINLKFEIALQGNMAFENGAQMVHHWFATINPLTPGPTRY
jgi:hypothetical protein